MSTPKLPYINAETVPLATDYQQTVFLKETVIPYLNALTGATPVSVAEEIVAEAPRNAQQLAGLLPEDFPYVALLKEAGVLTYEDLRAADDAVILGIPTIGESRFLEIRKAAGTA